MDDSHLPARTVAPLIERSNEGGCCAICRSNDKMGEENIPRILPDFGLLLCHDIDGCGYPASSFYPPPSSAADRIFSSEYRLQFDGRGLSLLGREGGRTQVSCLFGILQVARPFHSAVDGVGMVDAEGMAWQAQPGWTQTCR